MQCKVTIGCDPELFVLDDKGSLVSGHDLVRGTKKRPQKVVDGAVQVDGVALEINITPTDSPTQFVRNLRTVQTQLMGMLPTGFNLLAQPTALFTPEYFATIPEHALELGCEPDYCAYTGLTNPRPDDQGEPFRTGAGHIHIGINPMPVKTFSRDHFQLCCDLSMMMDVYVGLPSLVWDNDTKRRSLYGRAGAFRVKPYGLEYRTPSNAWTADDVTAEFVASQTLLCVDAFLKTGGTFDKPFCAVVADVINGNFPVTQSDIEAMFKDFTGLDFNLPEKEKYLAKQEG